VDTPRRASDAVVRISAAVVGGWITTVLGPEAGAGAAESISQIATQAVGFLWQKRAERVSRTLTQVSEETTRRIEAGEAVRPEIAEGEDAAVLFEAMVDAAADSIEQRRCRVIANVYASVAFDPDVSIPDALLYVSRIRACSWRQLVALQYLVAEDRARDREHVVVLGNEGDVDIAPVLSAEFSELASIFELRRVAIGRIGTGDPPYREVGAHRRIRGRARPGWMRPSCPRRARSPAPGGPE